MKRKFKGFIAAAAILTVTCSMNVFAAEWKHDETGYWYQNDDGTYPKDEWKEIDGKQYYFDDNGYMLKNTTTPDGYQVGEDGSWVQNTAEEQSSNVGGNSAVYGQYSINPVIFEEMNMTAGQLRDKYGVINGTGENGFAHSGISFGDDEEGTSLLCLNDSMFSEYYAHTYCVPPLGYNEAYDLNHDGVVDSADDLIAWPDRTLTDLMTPCYNEMEYYCWDQPLSSIQANENLFIGFPENVTADEFTKIIKAMGATDITIKTTSKQEEVVNWIIGNSGGITFDHTGRYYTSYETSGSFVLNGLLFKAPFSQNQYVKLGYGWRVKRAD